MKKLISIILLIAIISGILISCGNKNESEKTGDKGDDNIQATQNNQTGEETNTPAQEKIKPDLPEMDLKGYTFTFFAHRIDYAGDWVGDGDPREIVAEMQDGKEVANSEPINDAVYKRNLAIKEKYNIDIRMLTNSDDVGTLRKAVKAADSIYDAAVIFNNLVPGVVTANLLVNLEELNYIDLDKPWWDPAVKSMSIANQNYLMAGDLLILDNEATTGIIFNKDLMAQLGIDLPYEMVKTGKWTMDAMNNIIKDTAMDLNGDGKMNKEDRWGFSVSTDTLHALLVSGGGSLATKDADDIPYMCFTNEKNMAIINKAMDLMYNPEYVINVHGKDIEFPAYTMFEENKFVFMWMRMRVVERFRGMEANFGIIPMPKFDEAQEKYYSVVNPYTGVLLGVPKSAEDLDRVSIILEALSAESTNTLQTAYYDVALQRKYTRDNESSEMLDIIFGSRVYDIGGVYSFGNVFIDFIELSRKNDRNVMSYYDKKIGAMEKSINKVVDAFRSMD